MQPSRQKSSKRVVPEVLTSNFSHESTTNFSHKRCSKYSLLVFLDSSNLVEITENKKVPTNTWHKHLFPKICLTPSNMLYS